MAKAPPDPLFTFHGGMKGVHCIYYRDDEDGSSLIYCGTESGDVVIWNAQLLRQVNKIKIGILPCVSIVFHNNFITQERGGYISFWKENCKNWEKLFSFTCDVKMFCSILLLESILVYPYSESQVKFVNLNEISSYEALKFEGIVSKSDQNYGMAMCAKYSKNIGCILLCFENGSICCINPTSGEIESQNKFMSECPMCLDYCDVGNFGIIGFSNEDLIKFTLDEGNSVVIARKTEITNPGLSSIAIRNDGVLFVVGTWSGTIKYFSAKSLKLLAVLNHHSLSVECLKFIPNFDDVSNKNKVMTHLLAGSRDGRMSLWNLYPT